MSEIRSAVETDAQALTDLYNHYVVNTASTFEEEAVAPMAMWDRIEQVQSGLGLPWIVLEQNGELLGYACAVRWKLRSAYRFSCESSIYLHQDATGMGLGAVLYRALIDQLRERDIHTVLGGIALPNASSVALHEKLGFNKVAHLREVGYKFGQWVDVGYWQLDFRD